jgi:hypothetical protein
VLEVVGSVLSLDIDRRCVLYRIKGSEGLLCPSVEKWQQAVDDGALELVGLARPS